MNEITAYLLNILFAFHVLKNLTFSAEKMMLAENVFGQNLRLSQTALSVRNIN